MTSPDIQRLILEVRDAIMVLNQRGVVVTPSQADERARNIATGLIASYNMRPLPGPYTVDFADERISGRPIGHSWSCKCTACHTEKQRSGR
jgi:hypothetical protein